MWITILREVEPYISPKWQKQKRVQCKCDCGKIFETQLNHVKWLHTTSCWCYQKKKAWEYNSTHGMSDKRIYNIWRGIKRRCTNKNDERYHDYWWRWIKYDPRWNDFTIFYEEMKDWYRDDLTIDRTYNDWGYSKENCKWTTMKEQQINRRNTWKYKWKPVIQWCEELWLNYCTVYSRINKYWWNIEKALWL